MKKTVRTDDWSESGLFKSEADYKEFIARTRKKLATLKRLGRIRNCPKKKSKPSDYHDIPEDDHDHDQELINPRDLNVNVSDPGEKRAIKIKFIMRDKSTSSDHGEEKRQGKQKSAMEEKTGAVPPPEIVPRWLREAAEEMGGHGQRLLIEKKLSQSDVRIGQNRISMPVRQLQGPDDFLTEEELLEVSRRREDDDKRIEGLDVRFVEAGSRTAVLSLRKWDYGRSSSYVFAGKLQEFVKRNGLKAGEVVQIRFFRCRDGNPCFALVNLAAETASSSSSSVFLVPAQENQLTTDELIC